MKALILGAAGFIGRHISRELALSGYHVVGVDRGSFSSSAQWGVSEFHCFEVSKNNLKALTRREPFELVVNCVGSPSVGLSLTHPGEDFDLNVRIWSDVLEFVRLSHPKAHVVLLSSAAVYGESKTLPNRIQDLPTPVSPYGSHKFLAEQMGETYARNYQMRISAVRFFSIFGEGLKRQLLWDALLKFDQKKPIFFGTGLERRDWLHVEDAARLIVAIAKSETLEHGGYSVFNGGSGTSETNHALLSALASGYGFDEPIQFNNVVKVGDPKEYRAEISESLALGWKPKVSIAEGVHRYVAWFRNERTL